MEAVGRDSSVVVLPRCVVQEVLADGCCPLQLRVQLERGLCRSEDGSESCCSPDVCPTKDAARVAASVAPFLDLRDTLATRIANMDMLSATMQRQPDAVSAEGTTTTKAMEVRDRLRVRLWLHQMSLLVAGTSDESVFETRVQNFVDEALRTRLVADVAAAKRGMEEEVQAAKANMLQCVQAISEEVDRRVRDKVAALLEEFDARASNQVRLLQELVERRVNEQTALLQADVDRRAEQVRVTMQKRVLEQEEAAARLQLEVSRIRETLEERVREQKDAAAHLGLELAMLRKHLAELIAEREVSQKSLRRRQQRCDVCLPTKASLDGLASFWEHATRRLRRGGASDDIPS